MLVDYRLYRQSFSLREVNTPLTRAAICSMAWRHSRSALSNVRTTAQANGSPQARLQMRIGIEMPFQYCAGKTGTLRTIAV